MNPSRKQVTGNSPDDNSKGNTLPKKENSAFNSVVLDKDIRTKLETRRPTHGRRAPKPELAAKQKFLTASQSLSPTKMLSPRANVPYVPSGNKNAVRQYYVNNPKRPKVENQTKTEPFPRLSSLIKTSKNISYQTQSSKKIVSPQKSQIRKGLLPTSTNRSQKSKPSTSSSTKQKLPEKIFKDKVPQHIIAKRTEREIEIKKERLSGKIYSTICNKKVVHSKNVLPSNESRKKSFRGVLPPPIDKYDLSKRPKPDKSKPIENFPEIKKMAPNETFSNIIQEESAKENLSTLDLKTKTIKKSVKEVEFKWPPIIYSDETKVIKVKPAPDYMKHGPINTGLSPEINRHNSALKAEQKKIRKVAEVSSKDCRTIVSSKSKISFDRQAKTQELVESDLLVEDRFKKNPSFVLTKTQAITDREEKSSQIKPSRLERIQGESLGVAPEQPQPSEYLRAVEERKRPKSELFFSQDMKSKGSIDVDFVPKQHLSLSADKSKSKRLMFTDPLITNRTIHVGIVKKENKAKQPLQGKIDKPCGLARIQGQYLGLRNPTMTNIRYSESNKNDVKDEPYMQNMKCAETRSVGLTESFENISPMLTLLFDTTNIVDNTAQIADSKQTDRSNIKGSIEKSRMIQEKSVQAEIKYFGPRPANYKKSRVLSDTRDSIVDREKEVKQEVSKQETPKQEKSKQEQSADKMTEFKKRLSLMAERHKAKKQKQRSDSMKITSTPLACCNSVFPFNAKPLEPICKKSNIYSAPKKATTFVKNYEDIHNSHRWTVTPKYPNITINNPVQKFNMQGQNIDINHYICFEKKLPIYGCPQVPHQSVSSFSPSETNLYPPDDTDSELSSQYTWRHKQKLPTPFCGKQPYTFERLRTEEKTHVFKDLYKEQIGHLEDSTDSSDDENTGKKIKEPKNRSDWAYYSKM